MKHVKALYAIFFLSVWVTGLLGAPINRPSPKDATAKTVAAVPVVHHRVTSHKPIVSKKATSKIPVSVKGPLHVPSPKKGSSRGSTSNKAILRNSYKGKFNKAILRNPTHNKGKSNKAPTHVPISNGASLRVPASKKATPHAPNKAHTPGGATCAYPRKGKHGFIYRRTGTEPCSGDTPPSMEGTELYLHPHGDANGRKRVTIGKPVPKGTGWWGQVHNVASHELGGNPNEELVAKQITSEDGEPEKEIANLKLVDQYRGGGKDVDSDVDSESEDGHTWAVMPKAKGKHLKDTEAYQKSLKGGEGARDKVFKQASKLVAAAKEHHMREHSVRHDDVHPGNVFFQENDGNLNGATLVDWAQAEHKPGKYTQKEIDTDMQIAEGYKGNLVDDSWVDSESSNKNAQALGGGSNPHAAGGTKRPKPDSDSDDTHSKKSKVN